MVRSTIDEIFFNESTNEAVREALPEAAIPALELITHLGDGATLIVFATLLYWFGADSDRHRRALVIAIGLAALAISAGMKGVFLQPRPELAFSPDSYPGYSFPSAHALGGAAFYGALAVVADTGTKLQRYTIAGVVIFLIALSRIAMGVHYLGDVVTGVVIGLLFVWLVVRNKTAEPGFVFALAGILAIAAFALGSRQFMTMTIGASLGATVAWQVVKDRPWKPYGASILVLAYLVIPVIIALRAAPTFWNIHWITEIIGYAVVTASVLAVPAIAEHMNDWPPVEWLQRKLPFTGRSVDPERLPQMSADD